MAVLRSKRKVAKTEFENTFSSLYKFSMNRTSDIPKRRKKWLCKNIDQEMNRTYRDVMEINTFYTRDKELKAKHTDNLTERSILRLSNLEKPLMVLWNVQKTKTRTMSTWVDLICREINLLNLMRENEVSVPKMAILDWRAINEMNFLKNMSELHRYTHGKVINACSDYDDTQGALLIELVNDAFYYLMIANVRIPTTQKEYLERKSNISKSMSCLKELNRQMLFYFNLMQYSERIMLEWSEMLIQEIKMLTGLQKSDKERFGSLT